MQNLLVFHTRIAPYRVDFFNCLAERFNLQMCIDNKETYGLLSGNIDNRLHFDFRYFSSTDGLFSTFKYVINELKKNRPDIVMVSECGVISLIVVLYKLVFRGEYKIISIIDDSFHQLCENSPFTKRHQYAERVLIPRFTNIINVEPKTVEFFQERYKKGIFFPIIRDEVRYREQLRSAMPISQKYIRNYRLAGKKVVLFVGRFVSIKNVMTLIKSVRTLSDNGMRICLVLVGDGPEMKNYEELSMGMDVFFTGALVGSELIAWYNVAHVFVLPSLVEPFGAVVNEALMAGCPCVVSERAGSSCLVNNGVNGYVVNPLDEKAITNKIINVLEKGENQEMGRIRSCLMPYTFEERFKEVIQSL